MMVSSGNRVYDLGKWNLMETQADGSVDIHLPSVVYTFRLPQGEEVDVEVLVDTIARWTAAKEWGIFIVEDFMKCYGLTLERKAAHLKLAREGKL